MADGIRCSRCNEALPSEAFAPSHRKPGAWCRACRSEYMRTYRAPSRPRECLDCGSEYERWCYWQHPGAAGRRCKDCYLAYTRSRQTPERMGQLRPLITHGAKPSGPRWRRLQEQVWETETHCAICGEHVDQSLHHNTPMARSVDHIIPIAHGGAMYERDNVQLAHRSCNSRAGALLRTERLALARAALWLGSNL